MTTQSLRQKQRTLTRDTLIDAAWTAFEDRGYFETTIDDIVQRAGTSRPTFYANFNSKAQVLEAVARKLKLREEYQKLLEQFRKIGEPTVDALQEWFEKFADFYEKNLLIYKAIHQAEVIDREFAESQLATLQEFIDLWGAAGFVKNTGSDELRLSALMLFAAGEQFMYLWLVHGIVIERKRAARALAEALYATLRNG